MRHFVSQEDIKCVEWPVRQGCEGERTGPLMSCVGKGTRVKGTQVGLNNFYLVSGDVLTLYFLSLS